MTSPSRQSATAALGEFVSTCAAESLPPTLLHEGKRALLNFFGGALGVAGDPAVITALEIMRSSGGARDTTVIGHAEQLDPMGAAFVNAIAANLLDYDDTHLPTVIHPTAPVAPAALALGESRHLAGRVVLEAFVLGAEIECRLGLAVSPGHYDRGWHITATCGVFGAAAASARLLRLNPSQTSAALGIAASLSAGLVENLASGAKNVGVGNAARNGLLATMFAARGYSSAPAAIEGTLGWARAMGDSPALDVLLDGLGTRWEFRRNTYKPYPAGIVVHSVIDACLALRTRLQIGASDVAHVFVTGSPLLLARADRQVKNERDARVSIQHCAAVAFALGRAGVAEFSSAVVLDPTITALRAHVHASVDPQMPVGACSVRVETVDGRTDSSRVTFARGSAELPLLDADLEAKFRDNAERGGFSAKATPQIDAIWSIDDAPDTRALMRLMAP